MKPVQKLGDERAVEIITSSGPTTTEALAKAMRYEISSTRTILERLYKERVLRKRRVTTRRHRAGISVYFLPETKEEVVVAYVKTLDGTGGASAFNPFTGRPAREAVR